VWERKKTGGMGRRKEKKEELGVDKASLFRTRSAVNKLAECLGVQDKVRSGKVWIGRYVRGLGILGDYFI
jgi:hypothetical protein